MLPKLLESILVRMSAGAETGSDADNTTIIFRSMF